MEERQTKTAPGAAFDRAQALAGVDDDLELLRELVELFLEDCPAMLEEVGQAVAAGDTEALYRSAHTLKGSVGVIAAPVVSELAFQLEQMGRSGDLSTSAGSFAALDAEVARLVAELEALLGA